MGHTSSRIALCATALLTTLATTNAAEAIELPEQAYMVASFMHVDPDNDRGANDGSGYNFAYGWQWQERWAPEFAFNGAALDTGKTGGTDFYQFGLGADMRYTPFDWKWNPFAIAGLGFVRNDVVPDSLDSTNFYTNFGVGLTSPPGKYGIRARGEFRLIFDSFQSNQVDRRFALGLVIPLGVKEKIVEIREVEKIVEVEVPVRMLDRDGDGIPDNFDKCPSTLADAEVDDSGCMFSQIMVLQGVYFALDSAALTETSKNSLDAAVSTLVEQPELAVEIAGHTDSQGSDEYNLMLSTARANSVRSYLMSRGIAESRITARGYGESEPIDTNATPEGRAVNRRVEFRVRQGD